MAPDPRPGTSGKLLTRGVALLLAGLLTAAAVSWLGRPDPVLGRDDAPLLLVWSSADKLPELATAARSARGIGNVAQVRNGTGWLDSWQAGDQPPVAAPAGTRVPVEVMAVDPVEYASLLPDAQRPLMDDLSEGKVLLGATGARLRGIEDTGGLAFGETRLQVAGILDDNLVAGHEVFMSHETASGLEIDTPRYLIVELKWGTDQQEAAQRIRELLPDGLTLRTRGPDKSEAFRPGGQVMTQSAIKARFGEFGAVPIGGRDLRLDSDWILNRTANVSLPLVGSARCHKDVIPLLREALTEIAERDLGGLIDPGDFGGCFAPRFLNSNPHSGISHHSWGIAIDFNVSENRYGEDPTMDPRIVEIFEERGFAWGGRWHVPDGMHFEYLPEPER